MAGRHAHLCGLATAIHEISRLGSVVRSPLSRKHGAGGMEHGDRRQRAEDRRQTTAIRLGTRNGALGTEMKKRIAAA